MAKRDKAATLGERVESLLEAADLASGRLDVLAVEDARRVARQVDRRLAFAGDDTVIALAGATGSGTVRTSGRPLTSSTTTVPSRVS